MVPLSENTFVTVKLSGVEGANPSVSPIWERNWESGIEIGYASVVSPLLAGHKQQTCPQHQFTLRS
jgi:hypothetical protein